MNPLKMICFQQQYMLCFSNNLFFYTSKNKYLGIHFNRKIELTMCRSYWRGAVYIGFPTRHLTSELRCKRRHSKRHKNSMGRCYVYHPKEM